MKEQGYRVAIVLTRLGLFHRIIIQIQTKLKAMLNRLRIVQPYLMVACVFAIPMSVSLKSILLPICVIVNLLTLTNKRILVDMFKKPVVITALLLLSWCLLSTLWAPPQWHETQAVTSKMLKLIALPLFAIGFMDRKTRHHAQIAFVLAMTITAVISLIMAVSGKLFMGGADAGTVFNDRIMTGLFISIGAWLAAHLALQHKGKWQIALWMVFVICSLQVAFANTGRTGYIIYILLAICFSLIHLTFRQTMLLLLSLAVVAVVSYRLSPTLANNVDMTVYNISHFDKVANSSSIGYRVGFHQFAQKLFLQNPLFGTGAGSFSWHYDQQQPMPFYSKRLFEPHSQYWLLLVEQGLIGLLFFLAWLACLIGLIFSVQQSRAVLLFAFVAINAANFSDSLLLYSATGYLILIIAAMALAEYVENETAEKSSQTLAVDNAWQAV